MLITKIAFFTQFYRDDFYCTEILHLINFLSFMEVLLLSKESSKTDVRFTFLNHIFRRDKKVKNYQRCA